MPRIKMRVVLLAGGLLCVESAAADYELQEAAKRGDLDETRSLIATGSDVNEESANPSLTALHIAVEQEHLDVASFLIESGARVDRPVWAPLHVAAFTGSEEMARLLLDHGADIDAGAATATPTPLHVAARAGHEAMATFLVERGADVNARDALLSTALHWAVSGNQVAIAQRLIEGGAELNSKRRLIPEPQGKPGCAQPGLAVARTPRGVVSFRVVETRKGAAVDVSKLWDQTARRQEGMELAGSAELGVVPAAFEMESLKVRSSRICVMPTLVLPWNLGAFPEVELMLGQTMLPQTRLVGVMMLRIKSGYDQQRLLTPLDIAYAHEEMGEMTMILAAHGAMLSEELAAQGNRGSRHPE